jgi:hypothetical protein
VKQVVAQMGWQFTLIWGPHSVSLALDWFGPAEVSMPRFVASAWTADDDIGLQILRSRVVWILTYQLVRSSERMVLVMIVGLQWIPVIKELDPQERNDCKDGGSIQLGNVDPASNHPSLYPSWR